MLDRSALLFNISCLIILAIAGINYFAPGKGHSILFIVNLLVPFLIFSFFLFVFYWVFRRRKFLVVINVIALVFWYFFMGPYYMIPTSKSVATNDGIKIFTINAHSFRGKYWNPRYFFAPRFNDLIKKENPNIICLQEFDEGSNIQFIKDTYDYRYIFEGSTFIKKMPLSIYSKYPIISSGSINFTDTSNGVIYVDLKINSDTLRVYNIHLQSLKVRPGSFKREVPTSLLARLGGSFANQLEQVKILKEHQSKSPYKCIISGDFNTTQYSGAFRIASKGMKDSFIEKGNGYGTTYNFKFLPFRIDFILADKDIEIIDHRNYNIEVSDHYPVMATFKLN